MEGKTFWWLFTILQEFYIINREFHGRAQSISYIALHWEANINIFRLHLQEKRARKEGGQGSYTGFILRTRSDSALARGVLPMEEDFEAMWVTLK